MDSVTDNVARKRYELAMGEHTVFADYRIEGDVVYILYVEAPAALRGNGAAGALMQGIMENIRRRNLQVVPVCGYAGAWIERHPEFHDLRK